MSSITPKETMQDIARDQRDLHGPAWCWELAGDLLHQRLGPLQRQLGQDFLNVHHYRTLCAHGEVGKMQAFNLYPAIAAAEELNTDAVKTGHLKVAALGDLDPKEVAKQFNVNQAVLRTWEQTFFNVRGCQSATAWIQIHVIQPEVAAGRGELAARLRMVSSVGAGAAQAILKADTRLPIREAEKLLEAAIEAPLEVRRRSRTDDGHRQGADVFHRPARETETRRTTYEVRPGEAGKEVCGSPRST